MIYKASGTLIASCPVMKYSDLNIVLVQKGAEYVVSKYWSEHSEWVDGHYFTKYCDAHAYFVAEVLETLPLALIDVPKKLPGLVEKLARFLGKIAWAAV